jgi:hypothetical protein
MERDISIRNIVLIFAFGSFLPAGLSMMDHFTRSEDAFNDYTELCGQVVDFRRISSKGTFQGWRLTISSGGKSYKYQSRRRSFYVPMVAENIIAGQNICIRKLNGIFLMEPFIIDVWTDQGDVLSNWSIRHEYFSGVSSIDIWILLTSIFFLIIYFSIIIFERKFS